MNKTIAVIGANGRTGYVFTEAALAAGYTVRAGYYGSNNLPSHQNLTAIECNATNEADVRRLLDGADVVVSLIGHIKASPAAVQTDSIKTIVRVMETLHIRRIISLTGTGVRFPGDTPSVLDMVLNMAIKVIDPKRITDGINHAAFLQSTTLDWTILRVLKLTNGRHAGAVALSPSGPAELLTPRRRVAQAVLQVIADDSYKQTAPIIQGVA